jgi:hypothetical protein
MKLTKKEEKAIQTIFKVGDIGDDLDCVWAQPSDLIDNGYSKHETAGLWSSLLDKGAIYLHEERDKEDGGDLFTVDWDLIPQWKQIACNALFGGNRPITGKDTRSREEWFASIYK